MHSKTLALLLLVSTATACSDDGWTITIEPGEQASGSEVDKLPASWSAQDDPSILDFENDFITLFDSLPTEGQAGTAPWAGSYWPTHEDSINYRWDKSSSETLSPAAKFEKAFGRDGIADSVSANYGIDSRVTATVCTKKADCDSKKGEVCAKREGDSEGRCIETWFGICHAWAPAAAMTDEPKRAVMHNGVEFKINDIKALVSLSYTNGLKTRFLSKRCNAKNDGTDEGIQFDDFGVPTEEFEECADTNAGTFHVVAANYLGIKKKSFVEDRTFDYQVWNQPVMGFEIKAGYPKKLSAAQANKLMSAEGEEDYLFNSKATQWRHVKTTVSYISESPSELDGNLNETIKTYTRKDHYEYILELDSAGHVIGGEWLGASKKAHPDFLWAPEKKNNTEVAPPHLEVGSEALSVAKDTWAYLNPIDVTPGESLRVVMKSNRAKDEQGNVDLFVNFMTKPSKWSWSCRSEQDGSAEVCDVEVPWNQHLAYIGVLGIDADDDVQVTTSRIIEGAGISWKEVEMLLDRSLTLEDAPDTFDDLPPGSLDWGDTCEGGFADLNPTLTDEEPITLGLIPTGKLGVRVALTTDVEADLVVYDKISGTLIVGPDEALLGDVQGCAAYYGATYCTSGETSNASPEWFEVQGVTTRELVVRVASDGAGDGVVDYQWDAQPGCESVLSESYEYEVEDSETLVVSTVPAGAQNVLITLTSESDLDLQLFTGDTPLVYWDSDDDSKGLLFGATEESAEHEGLTMTYSGYSGTDGNTGHEFIKLYGSVSSDLEVRVFGYESGSAQISLSSGLPDDQVSSEL